MRIIVIHKDTKEVMFSTTLQEMALTHLNNNFMRVRTSKIALFADGKEVLFEKEG